MAIRKLPAKFCTQPHRGGWSENLTGPALTGALTSFFVDG